MKLQDVIHYYLGCEVVDARYEDCRPAKIHLVTTDGRVQLGRSDEIKHLETWHKLLLRPLEDMNKIECVHLGWFHPVSTYNAKSLLLTGITPDKTHYLLSKHFDLFDLLKNGYAIDKTKPTQP